MLQVSYRGDNYESKNSPVSELCPRVQLKHKKNCFSSAIAYYFVKNEICLLINTFDGESLIVCSRDV